MEAAINLLAGLLAPVLPTLAHFGPLAHNFFAFAGCMAIGTCLLPYVWAFFTHWDQDIKKRYDAKWAIVTGASSGIGLSIARALAKQGLNVVLAALPDDKLRPTDLKLADAVRSLTASFPACKFRALPVELGAPGYLEAVAEATVDLPISLVFNNAGYMVTGFFEDGEWAKHEANIACNETSAIALTHLFLRRMKAAGLRGAITFTSSPANIFPSPFSCLYGATKAAVSHFATSLAVEVKADGIDVAVIHPSPVATNFYAGVRAPLSSCAACPRMTSRVSSPSFTPPPPARRRTRCRRSCSSSQRQAGRTTSRTCCCAASAALSLSTRATTRSSGACPCACLTWASSRRSCPALAPTCRTTKCLRRRARRRRRRAQPYPRPRRSRVHRRWPPQGAAARAWRRPRRRHDAS
jgi:short-subunit dehydrogenase